MIAPILMEQQRPILVDNKGLTEIAKRHFGNRSILYPEFSLRRQYLPTPLMYLHPFAPNSLHLLYQQKEKVVAAASLENHQGASLFKHPSSPHYADNVLFLYGLCVHPRHRKQGHASGLVKEIFEMAADEKKILQISPFSIFGEQYLAPKIAEIHMRDYPDVKVLYPRQSKAIQGLREYTLSFQAYGFRTNVEFK